MRIKATDSLGRCIIEQNQSIPIRRLLLDSWTIQYKGNLISVENSLMTARLYVNNELQDETYGWSFSERLYGRIPTGNNTFSEVKVVLGGFWSVHCRIFVDCHLIFHSDPDAIAAREVQRNLAAVK
jgi:hypothetical protein